MSTASEAVAVNEPIPISDDDDFEDVGQSVENTETSNLENGPGQNKINANVKIEDPNVSIISAGIDEESKIVKPAEVKRKILSPQKKNTSTPKPINKPPNQPVAATKVPVNGNVVKKNVTIIKSTNNTSTVAQQTKTVEVKKSPQIVQKPANQTTPNQKAPQTTVSKGNVKTATTPNSKANAVVEPIPNATAEKTLATSETKKNAKEEPIKANTTASSDPMDLKNFKFSRAQRRRINTMIRRGMSVRRAKQIERDIYLKLNATPAKTSTDKRPANSIGSRSDEPATKRSKIEPSNQEVKSSSVQTNVPPKKVTLNKLTQTHDIVVDNVCRVAVAHTQYPNIKLSSTVIQQIKQSLLDEVEQLEGGFSKCLGFTNSVVKDGWLCLSCVNEETWLINITSSLKPFPVGSLKAFSEKELIRYECILILSPEDVLPPQNLLTRLKKQNGDLNTSNWTILKIIRTQNGGEKVIFSIDFISRNKIIAKNNKLFLNFSRIDVKVRDAAEMEDKKAPRSRNNNSNNNHGNNNNNHGNNNQGNNNHGNNNGAFINPNHGGMYPGNDYPGPSNNFNYNLDSGWLNRLAEAYEMNTGNSFQNYYRR